MSCGPRQPRCEPCRTINLARVKEITDKPDMQMYKKCIPAAPCVPVQEVPCWPACIKVVDKEEFLKCTCKQIPIPHVVPRGHGPFFYLVKAGIVAGTMFFTYKQGIWGDQRDTNECMLRWAEYIRNLNKRRPPNFDKCGKVIVKESSDSIISPIYHIYKSFITSIFTGVVKFPTIVKCLYLEWKEKMRKAAELRDLERKLKKKA